MAHPRLVGWAGRRVFITGHTGFVGSWFTATLLQLGARVVGFANSTDEHMKERDRWLGDLGADSVRGDIRDFDALLDALGQERFDAVVHLAAQPLVSVGLAEPRETMETNVCGSINLLEAARLRRPRAVVHVTSDKCYRNRDWPWPYREVDELGGGCPYSISKAAAELVFEGYATLYRGMPDGPRSASVRFGNVVGGGDFAERRLVPDCLAALSEGRPIQLRRPDAVRPWQHVLDVVYGLLSLVDRLAGGTAPAGEVFNFAPPGDGATAAQLASALIRAWGSGATVAVPSSELVEDQILRLDGRKAASALDWRHRLDVDLAADWIVRWHRSVSAGATAAETTVRQIEEFLAQVPTPREATGP